MKTTFLTPFFLLTLSLSTQAQNLIAVQNGNSASFYTLLDSAIIHAQNGDTVYIPGGTFSLSVSVDKRLHIIGVGSVIDSTLATGKSIINGNLSLINDASYGSIMGISLLGVINTSENIYNYHLQRNYLAGLSMAISCSNWVFIENNIQGSITNNVIGSIANPSPGVSNCYFYNNIIGAFTPRGDFSYFGFNSSVFKNNVFLYSNQCYDYYNYCYAPIAANFSLFENNIFVTSMYNECDYKSGSSIANSALHNNLFVAYAYLNCSQNWGTNNIFWQELSTVFGPNYQLQPTCPGKNAGKDGTDIGIYGGAFPWKAGSVPSNPHIQFENVSGVDDAGNIHVKVKVAAQDR
jgi:hypothetical protein